MTKPYKPKLPDLKTREELAKFWDTYDVTDYLHEMKPVKATVAQNLSSGITVRFDAQTLKRLKKQAHEKGVGTTTLIRMWVLERLKTPVHP